MTYLEFSSCFKALSTNSTGVWPHSRVTMLVFLQCMFIFKTLVTHNTCMWAFLCVTWLVVLQVLLTGKPVNILYITLVTHDTCMWAFLCVTRFVILQVLLTGKPVTCIWNIPLVTHDITLVTHGICMGALLDWIWQDVAITQMAFWLHTWILKVKLFHLQRVMGWLKCLEIYDQIVIGKVIWSDLFFNNHDDKV